MSIRIISSKKRKERQMKKLVSLALSFALCITSTLASTSVAFANDTENEVITERTLGGEPIVTAYVENNELYVVTRASSIPPGGGKCPSSSKTVTVNVSRAQLAKWRDDATLEYNARVTLSGVIGGALGIAFSTAYSVLNFSSSSLAKQCDKLLVNSTKSTFTLSATFSCASKVQAGSWFHTWKLTGVRAY